MSDLLFGIGVGLIFALAGVTCLVMLIGLGQLIEWYEGRTK